MTHTSASTFALKKTVFVNDFALGDAVSDLFLLSMAQQYQAKNGPYWRLEFRDRQGNIGGKIWSPQSQAYPDLAPGVMVRVQGRITSFRDALEIAVDTLAVLKEEEVARLDLSLFMPASPHSPESMLRALQKLAETEFTYPPWKRFFAEVLADADIAQTLTRAPAAKAMHHAYVGGLLEHTLSVAELAMRLADHYPLLDRQVLLAGALCHDIGKIWELTQGMTAEYTTPGRLLGHMQLALDRLTPMMQRAGLEPDLAEHLSHLILSHHGSREFGSPILPMTAEAFALHYADILDAKMHQVEKALSHLEDKPGWSAYTPALERFLYKAVPTPQSGALSKTAEPFLTEGACQVPPPLAQEQEGACQAPPPLMQEKESPCPRPLPSDLPSVPPVAKGETEPGRERQPHAVARQCSLLSKG